VDLWSHAVQVTTDNDAAETYLGQALVRAGRPQAAIPHFQRAIDIAPAAPKAYMFLGYAEQQLGQPRTAIAHYQQALELCQRYGMFALPIRVATLQSMAYAYRDIGDFPRAEQTLEAAQEAAQR
jgi:tetratricopeptide (TPR) repeat protein